MSTYTRILLQGTWQHPLSRFVKNAIESSVQTQNLPAHITFIEGMSGKLYREFVNNLVRSVPEARYLEIGSWAGSTACAAIYNNTLTITCIDNWSEFGGPKEAFFTNINNTINKHTQFTFIESDFRAVDYTAIGLHNLYLFDGPHTYADQKDGICIVSDALTDTYILIVDDYNWPEVRQGTHDGIAALGHIILDSVEIRTTEDDSHPVVSGKHSNWHNGYYIAIISKTI
jgi:hypothetical protein